ncbi:hypothetical protein C8R44DRAFT_880092 [Mycena epipterygia]|nr:hypothetical protein C8R44DRAFT_880092 [Mycena epipterygia]
MAMAVKERTFKRAGKASHIRSDMHKEAMAALNKATAIPRTESPAPIMPAHLSFIDLLHERPFRPNPIPINNAVEDPLAGVVHFDRQYFDSDGDQIMFSAGPPLDTTRFEMQEIQRQMEGLSHISHSQFGKFSTEFVDDSEELETPFGGMMQDESDGEDITFSPEDDSEWLPHGSKTMFMLDLLDNLPRLRLSDDQLKSIIWVMRECGTPNDWGNPLVRPFIHLYPDVSGPISESWQAGKWTGEVDLDELSPMWADWKSSTSHRHYYIKELAQLTDGSFVIPLRWVTANEIVHADVLRVEHSYDENSGDEFHVLPNTSRIPAKMLQSNFLDLRKVYQIRFAEYSPAYEMPHPLREKANGKPIFRLRVMPWSDDVSGNVSKQYNAHTNVYVTNLNLPHQKLSQEYFVRFCSTSPHASSSEQFVALGDDFKPGTWHEAYDCHLEEEILFEIIPHVLPADNPQQSETSSHIGMPGSLGCRRDLTGGSKQTQETDEGYHAMYMPGEPREMDSTIQAIRWQLWMACLGNKTAVNTSQTATGVKDKIAQHWIKVLLERTKIVHQAQLSDRATRDPALNDANLKGDQRSDLKTKIKRQIQQEMWDWLVQQPHEFVSLRENDPFRLTTLCDLKPGIHYNILLSTRGINPHQDTPGEILHTYLLGNDKYVWHDTLKSWDAKKDDIFASRLQASFLGGLSIPPPRARYVVQYKNSLIGKHFKMLQQLAVFHLHDLCSPLVFSLWKATGELGALLWYPVIKAMDLYLADLQILIDNVLDIWGLIDPNRILVKGKLHVLSHLVDDARRFGPPVLYATEIFECWNAIFRLCSILSNHLSPSHDIAVTLADMERFKHMEIMFELNVQHDCVAGNCGIKDVRIRQERILTDITQGTVSHSDTQRYILNMHGLHNAHLIRDVLPRELVAPIPYLADRVATHRRFAAQLRISGPAKRTATQAKTRATKEGNKRKRTQIASEQAIRQRDEDSGGSESEGNE